ncbi:membrane protein insertase YidC [Roseivirga sp. BDSF3-8]|uniref:membrane protein insertase YidC n=1 Tax=Roseivirga sp. BDSF3-8 TaxID=3241598 RepID=UPI0035326134
MDKNQAVGLLLMSLLLAAYFWFFSGNPEQQVQQPEQAQTELTEDSTTTTAPEETQLSEEDDSLRRQRMSSRYGNFAAATEGTEAETVLENELVKVTLSNKGGSINRVQLKNYTTWDDKPLYLVTPESSKMSMVMNQNGRQIDLRDLYFEPTEVDSLQNGIAYVLNTGDGKTITQVYSLQEDGYVINYSLMGEGAAALGTSPLQISWMDELGRYERRIEESRQKMKVNYYTAEGDFEDFGENVVDDEVSEMLDEPVKWIGLKQKFFTSAIIAEKAFAPGTQVDLSIPSSNDVVKTAEVKLTYPADQLNAPVNFDFYYGPNNYQVLKKVTDGFSENVDLGWGIISWFNKFLIIPIFQFLENYIGSYGIIIIILVVIIKILLLPLSYKSYISMAKTKVLKPELDELKEKYGDDMQKQQQEQMKLYQKVGINPISGCIPMLLQLPILLAMFNFFPNSIELRQEPFLWANDLSTYDALIQLPFDIPMFGSHLSLFALLMTASTLLYTYTNQQMSTVQGPMKNIGYIMPVVFFFVLNSFAAGLTFYYFVSNVVTMIQQPLIRKFVDDDKIRAILEENKRKAGTKKKSGFQARLEDAMKKAEETRRQQQDDKKKRKR